MPLPSLLPALPNPADPPVPPTLCPVVGAAELARLAHLFAARGILLVQGPLPAAAAPGCPRCGATDGWFTVLLTQERVCRCVLAPPAGPGAG
jgi:hypothetical protein